MLERASTYVLVAFAFGLLAFLIAGGSPKAGLVAGSLVLVLLGLRDLIGPTREDSDA